MPRVSFDISQTREFSFEDDTEPKTVFILGVLDSGLSSHLFDNAFGYRMNHSGPDEKADVVVNKNRLDRQIVRFGLRGWRNLVNAKGDDEPFIERQHISSHIVPELGNRNGLTDRALDLIKPYIAELSAQIEEMNVLSDEEKKKLPG